MRQTYLLISLFVLIVLQSNCIYINGKCRVKRLFITDLRQNEGTVVAVVNTSYSYKVLKDSIEKVPECGKKEFEKILYNLREMKVVKRVNHGSGYFDIRKFNFTVSDTNIISISDIVIQRYFGHAKLEFNIKNDGIVLLRAISDSLGIDVSVEIKIKDGKLYY